MRDGETEITAEAYLGRLAERGIEYVFANAGTDFASIIEAVARNHNGRRKYPKVVTVPHENVAMSMAHGYYRISGKPACVMVHVNVGTANALNGLVNAARDNVPVLLAAGRTPLTETGSIASRNRSIHWGQEMFDQGGMVREIVKWDYELRTGQPVTALVDRALDIAMSEPRGPVYMTLPREVLASPAVAARRDGSARSLGAAPAVPSESAIEDAAAILAGAEFPLIITSSAGRAPAAMAELAALANEFALPVVQNEARDINLPTDHPMHLGFESASWLGKADAILVLDSVVPWIPRTTGPKAGAKIIHMSPDPLAARYPFREVEADLLVTGETRTALALLRRALAEATKGKQAALDARRKAVTAAHEELMVKRRQVLESARSQSPIHPAWLAACVNEQKAKDAIVVSELGLNVGQLDLTVPGSYMGNLLSGGLGFGLGAALGAKIAAPDREVIVAVGDGSYMFGNPLPFHYMAHAENLPTLTIVANNHSWHAVRRATLDVYPEGAASKANSMVLTDLKPSPSYEKTIETVGGYGEKVENPAELPAALKRALAKVRAGTPALLNVHTHGR
ncbi:MAG TPA: thiamine pyrophosphate-requiring protein [Alphaproteobacteria bacterium]|nr:thiamine pyrophosphate-requiring protein [Alphaproteobacteria bacterium]